MAGVPIWAAFFYSRHNFWRDSGESRLRHCDHRTELDTKQKETDMKKQTRNIIKWSIDGETRTGRNQVVFA